MVKIEEGKFYRTYGGIKIGPMQPKSKGWWGQYRDGRSWDDSGKRYGREETHPTSICSEWVDSPEFTLDWPHGHKTRSGEKVRILCHDLKGDQPIVIVREDREGREYLEKRYSNGVMFEDYKNGLDIINAPMECIS